MSETKSCPEGQHLDPTTNECVPNKPVEVTVDMQPVTEHFATMIATKTKPITEKLGVVEASIKTELEAAKTMLNEALAPVIARCNLLMARTGLKEQDEETHKPPCESGYHEVDGRCVKDIPSEVNEVMNARDERYQKMYEEFEKRVLNAVWDTETINNLPDECFAFIESGGSKDESGKTAPRSLRHLPFKNTAGNVDHEHLINALSRLPQTSINNEAKETARRKLCGAVDSWNNAHKEDKIDNEVCNSVTEALRGKPEKAPVVKLPAIIEGLQYRALALTETLEQTKASLAKLESTVEEVLKKPKVQESLSGENEEEERKTALKELVMGKK